MRWIWNLVSSVMIALLCYTNVAAYQNPSGYEQAVYVAGFNIFTEAIEPVAITELAQPSSYAYSQSIAWFSKVTKPDKYGSNSTVLVCGYPPKQDAKPERGYIKVAYREDYI